MPMGDGLLGLGLLKPGLLDPGEAGDAPGLELEFGCAPKGFGFVAGTLPIRCPVRESSEGSQINSNWR